MNEKQWYESLFENYGQRYDNENFTQGTIGECDFIETELRYNKSLRVLDVGCGTGRHSVELTRRGYSVTGIDLSETQLKRVLDVGCGTGRHSVELTRRGYSVTGIDLSETQLKRYCEKIQIFFNFVYPKEIFIEK